MQHTIYSKNNCPACAMTKKRLVAEGKNFVEINIDAISATERERTLDFIKNELQFTSLPVVVPARESNQDSFSGFRPDRIKSLP